jgi:hypothetical protein
LQNRDCKPGAPFGRRLLYNVLEAEVLQQMFEITRDRGQSGMMFYNEEMIFINLGERK